MDTLIGGAGDDTYVVANAGDVVTEAAGGGTDTVRTALASFTLAANVENLTYTGAAAFVGTGNSLANVIIGGAGADTLTDGTNTAGIGVDTLIGGAGADTYNVSNVGDVITEAAGGGTDTVRTTLSSYTLDANVENLTFSGAAGNFAGTGNALVNTITGGTGNDTLDGGKNTTGVDTLVGGAGNDTYIVRNLGDVTTENNGAGTDTVLAAVNSYTLGTNVENLTFIGAGNFTGIGNAAANVIAGGTGNDTLTGGAGADTFTMNAGFGVDVDHRLHRRCRRRPRRARLRLLDLRHLRGDAGGGDPGGQQHCHHRWREHTDPYQRHQGKPGGRRLHHPLTDQGRPAGTHAGRIHCYSPASCHPAPCFPLPLSAGDAPDHIAHIVRHQHGAVGADGHADRASVGHPFVRREESGQDIARRSRRAAVRERNEHKACSRSACCGSTNRAVRWPCHPETREACRPAASTGRVTPCAHPARSRA